MVDDLVSNEEIIQLARRKLAQGNWDYATGGSESETTMRRNRLAFDRIAFRPRVCIDVTDIDPSTTFLGSKLRTPVMLAPLGSMQTFHPDAAVAAAKAASEFGTFQVVSSVTQPSLEETAAAGDFPKIFQMYIEGDWDWIADLIGRVKRAGYTALCVTADTSHYSRRERPLLSRWRPRVRFANYALWQKKLTWELLDRIKEEADPLPIMLKGVATAEDAALSVEHGVDVVWVSNHGGRQLDHCQGTMEVMHEVMEAVDGKAEVVVDGGVLRGSDVAKAIAMGAKAVAIGKLEAWGLAADGADGVRRVLEILEEELIIAMALMGVTEIGELGPSYVCEAEAVVPPHEMSAWVNKPVDRIL